MRLPPAEARVDELLEGSDVTAPELVARLAARGVTVPMLLPPEAPPPSGPWGPTVYFPCSENAAVTAGLAKAVRPGIRWGWNTDEQGRCWVVGEEDAELPDLVRSLVSDPASVEVVQWDGT